MTTKRWLIIAVVAIVAATVVVWLLVANAQPGTGYKLTGVGNSVLKDLNRVDHYEYSTYPPASASQVVRHGADTVSSAVVRAATDVAAGGR